MSGHDSVVHVIGAGLAGAEAAWQLASRNIPVRLYEMRPERTTPAHQTGYCAELVCSNSFRSDDADHNAVGLLHQEMRFLGSKVMMAADNNRLPAGSALAVDRHQFADWITQRLQQHPFIELVREEKSNPPESELCLIATGPLTSDAMSHWLQNHVDANQLAFFDAIAPIVSWDSIDLSKTWKQSRYGKGGDDYVNCPLDKQQYEHFVAQLGSAQKVAFREFEQTPYFEGCLPIEVMASRGLDTLRYGPMKPVGLNNPHRSGETPWAVVQLRQDNQSGTLWNMVGFQTKMTWPEQQRVFRLIPGLEQAEFERLGAIHRNTFIRSPDVLDGFLRLKRSPNLFFAGQLIGVEGYVESAASGLLAGIFMSHLYRTGHLPEQPPVSTAHGALLSYVTTYNGKDFQPMNVNFGLFPPLAAGLAKKKDKKPLLAKRAMADLAVWREQCDNSVNRS